MSKATANKTNMDFIMYRLESIEKRLDWVEKQMHVSNKHGESPEIIRLLLDLIKNGDKISHESQPECVKDKDKVEEMEKVKTPTQIEKERMSQSMFNYDNLTSLTRRRTVV